jgi:hypothetical protein
MILVMLMTARVRSNHEEATTKLTKKREESQESGVRLAHKRSWTSCLS